MPGAPKWQYKPLDFGEVSAGIAYELSWAADKKYTLERVFIVDRDGYTLYKVDASVRIEDQVITKEAVPAALFAPDEWLSPVIDYPVEKGETITITLTNKDTVSHYIIAILKLKLT